MGSSASMIGDNTIALSLQNGIGCEEIMGAAIGSEKVIGAMTMQGGVYVSPGRIRHINNLPTYLGELDGSPTARVREIGDIFSYSGIETIVTERRSEIHLEKGTLLPCLRSDLGDLSFHGRRNFRCRGHLRADTRGH